MGSLQILVAAASLALTYGGVLGADMLMSRIADGVAAEQAPAPAAEPQAEEDA